ncbi:MAG: hypothetical protein IKX10_05605 [Lachnospiraceae bacterium]|nr:hypothetical protein [Lachnospiraceae bacterium]
MRRKMITVSTALALMLSVAGCKDKAPEETTTAAAATTQEVGNAARSTTSAASATEAKASQEETTKAPTPIVITSQPKDMTIDFGSSALFAVYATGDESLSYQWEFRSDDSAEWMNASHSGSNTATLTLTSTDYYDGYQFRCSVTDATGQVQYSEPATLSLSIPLTTPFFPNEAFRNYLKQNYDTDQDNYLSPSERQITQMNIYVYSDDALRISNVKGLEYFRELEELTIKGVGLTELDTRKNRKLRYLNCSNNQLTSLLTRNPELKVIDCNSNQLIRLDVSQNPNLRELFCSDNHLTSLNIDGCTKLFTLQCVKNELENLSFHYLPDLIDLYLDADVELYNIARRFTTPPHEDGWYYSSYKGYAGGGDVLDDNAGYNKAEINNGYLTIDGCLGKNFEAPAGDIYDCGTIQLRLAKKVTCCYYNFDGTLIEFPVEQFNIFDIYDKELEDLDSWAEVLEVHLSNGRVDQININWISYP